MKGLAVAARARLRVQRFVAGETAMDRIEKHFAALRQSQESSDRALKAVIALLLERGHFTADELRARISRVSRGGA